MNDLANPAPAAEPPATLLCVDDEPNILSALRRLFRPCGYKVLVANSGAEGLVLLAQEKIDLVISDMRMPIMDGAAFLAEVRSRQPEAVRILLTGYADIESTVAAINEGEIYRYVAKPWTDHDMLATVRDGLERRALRREKERLEALTLAQNEALKALNAGLEDKVRARTEEVRQTNQFLELANQRLKQGFLTSIKVFSNLIELRHGAMAGHSRRVAEIARRTAREMGLKPKECQDVFLAGLLHDIGKIGLSDGILDKPWQKLSADEAKQWRHHPAKGEQALMALEELRDGARLIRSHHERFDGNGYPDGLEGEQIPLGARILTVPNEYDGLLHGSLIGRKVPEVEAQQLIRAGSGKRYDPLVVDAFFAVLAKNEEKAPAECLLSPAELKPGMVLARDFVSREGVLLLATDYVLDMQVIIQIRGFAQSEDTPVTLSIRPLEGLDK